MRPYSKTLPQALPRTSRGVGGLEFAWGLPWPIPLYVVRGVSFTQYIFALVGSTAEQGAGDSFTVHQKAHFATLTACTSAVLTV